MPTPVESAATTAISDAGVAAAAATLASTINTALVAYRVAQPSTHEAHRERVFRDALVTALRPLGLDRWVP